jgi:hypothetical protein
MDSQNLWVHWQLPTSRYHSKNLNEKLNISTFPQEWINPHAIDLTHILNNQFLAIMLSQIQLERTPKQLQQHLKATLGNSRVIPALAELIANESIYIISKSASGNTTNGTSVPRFIIQTHAEPKQLHKN